MENQYGRRAWTRELSRPGRLQNSHVVASHHAVAGYQHEIFDHCLSNQHPVERIGVMARQRSGDDRMSRQNRQRFKAHPLHDVIKLVDRKGKAPDRGLDRNFPDRNTAHGNMVFRRCQGTPLVRPEADGRCHSPDESMGVEQEVQRA
jgi:hypothetical protein